MYSSFIMRLFVLYSLGERYFVLAVCIFRDMYLYHIELKIACLYAKWDTYMLSIETPAMPQGSRTLGIS